MATVSTQGTDATKSSYYNYTITRTWTATDASGNSSSKSQVITVEDKTAPVISCPASVTINCQAPTTTAANGSATATDNCSPVTITSSDISTKNANNLNAGFYNYTITRTWRATDVTGNFSECAQTITVRDVTAPIITCPASVTINCQDATTVAANGSATATDNCSPVTITSSDVSTQNSSATNAGFYNYTITRTWKVTDVTGNSSTCVQVITVQDITKPMIIVCPADVTVSFSPSLCGQKVTIGPIVATDNCTSSTSLSYQWTMSGATSGTGTNASIGEKTYNFGSTIINWKVTDASGNFQICSTTVKVDKLKVVPELTLIAINDDGSEKQATNCEQQYSDRVKFKVIIVNGASKCSPTAHAASSATFSLADLTGKIQVMEAANFEVNENDLVASLIVNLSEGITGIMRPGKKSVSVLINNLNTTSFDVQATGAKDLNITQENAIPYYTGSSFVSTASITSTSASVLLNATVKDISVTPSSTDNKPGNIKNARVRFVNRDITPVPIDINTATSASGYYISDWLTPGLISANDTTTGIVTANWTGTIGSNADAQQFTVGIIVDNGYYIRNSSTDNAVITVSKPLDDFVTGGGYIIMTNAIGSINPQQGLRNNFGFNIKRKSNGVLNGNINSIIRCTNGKVYQVKGNAMLSLSVTPATNTGGAKAVFTGKANWQDITNPLLPVSVFSGNNTLQVTMTDRGEPGNTDDISIIVWDNNNNLLFSSNWDGTRTIPQVLDGGNIKIHNTASVSTGSTASTTTITSSKNPAFQGETVIFTAKVVSSGTIKPTGTFTFVDVTNNSAVLGTLPLNTTTGIATFSISGLSIGTHAIVAYYSSDSRYMVSSASLNQVINPVPFARSGSGVVENTTTKIPKEEVIEIPLQIAIGPVPSNSKFTLQVLSSSNEVIDMIILNINGQVIQKVRLAKGSTIDFGSNYRAGSYFVQVIQGKQKVLRKIIKF